MSHWACAQQIPYLPSLPFVSPIFVACTASETLCTCSESRHNDVSDVSQVSTHPKRHGYFASIFRTPLAHCYTRSGSDSHSPEIARKPPPLTHSHTRTMVLASTARSAVASITMSPSFINSVTFSCRLLVIPVGPFAWVKVI